MYYLPLELAMSTNSTTTISESTLSAIEEALGKDRVVRNAPLKNHTWIKAGGNADLFFIAKSRQDLLDAVKVAHEQKTPLFMLGGGSNLLIRDGGLRGLVVKNRATNITLAGIKGGVVKGKTGIKEVSVKAESGVSINQLVRYAIDESLEGIEEFLGVPGTIGGAVYNNAHHLTHLIGDYISVVEVVTLAGEVKTYTGKQMKFAYDYSIIQETKDIVLSATFSLKTGDKAKLWALAEAALKRRRATQPLEKPSSGCMFKNISTADALANNTPNHTQSAGQLIDLTGLKGMKIGGAEVSTVHANFIVNNGGASASDVLKLSKAVIDRVKERFGVTLEREVFIVGES
jgi:UDP-N-acetylmuramate dehydrogenase